MRILSLPSLLLTICLAGSCWGASPADELFEAAGQGDLPAVERLIRTGAKVNTPSEGGMVPLSAAVFSGKLDMVRYLMEHGATVNGTDQTELTPLMLSVHARFRDDYGVDNLPLVKYLLDHGAQVNAKNRWGQSALMIAAAFGKKGSALLLIERGAQVSATDAKGNTPLHYAIEGGPGAELINRPLESASPLLHMDPEILRLLVEKGAKVSARNSTGQEAIDLAVERSPSLIAYLRSKGGRAVTAPIRGAFAPPFNYVTLDGQRKKLSDHSGKWVLLYFNTTCGDSCKEAVTVANRLEREFASLVVIGGFAVDEVAEPVKATRDFTVANSMFHDVFIADSKGNDIIHLYRLRAVPEAFLIKPDGTVAAKILGKSLRNYEAAVGEMSAVGLVR